MMVVVQCPCGARFKADDRWVGRRARCKQCGVELVIAEAPPASTEPPGDAVSLIDESLDAGRPKATPSERTAPGFRVPTPIIETASAAEPPQKPSFGPFLRQCLWSLLLFGDPGSMATFFIVVVLVCFSATSLVFLGCWGWFLAILVWSMVCALMFATIEETALGRESLPNLEAPDDGWAGLVGTVLKFFGTIWLVQLPALAVVLLDWWLDILPDEHAYTVARVLTWAGLALWPMVVLIVSMGDFGSLWRIDLIVMTIARTIGAYLLLCALVGGTYAAIEQARSLLASSVGGGGQLAAAIAVQVLSVYGLTVTMCFIGAYYHHFKHRFAWSWG